MPDHLVYTFHERFDCSVSFNEIIKTRQWQYDLPSELCEWSSDNFRSRGSFENLIVGDVVAPLDTVNMY